MLLAIDWGSVGIKALQFILSFSILVTLHEFGHYITARWFKCRVEKFYLFFNPWFSLWKKKIGDTEYGIGWVPFGGYVKIAGMIDESMDKEQMKKPPEAYEFRSKPAWQRFIIMTAGVVVNLILGFLIYAMMLWHWGEEYIPTNKMTYGVSADSLAQSIGFRDGDKLLSVDGKYYDKFKMAQLSVILDNAKTVEVERGGQKVSIAIPGDFVSKILAAKDVSFIELRTPFEIREVGDTSVAQKAGLQKGDKVVSVNEKPIQFFDEFRNAIISNKNKPVTIKYLRKADTLSTTLTVPPTSMIGIATDAGSEKYFEVKKTSYSFFESFPAGFQKCKETLRSYWLQLKLIFSGKVKAKDSVGGIFSIGNMFGSVWDWQSFWSLTAFFSLVLALMNIMPIPALDGGHALFCIIEMVTGRKPSEKVMEYAQMIGMVLLLGLMVYALGLDVWRMFK